MPLTRPFLDYLRADGILLPPEPSDNTPATSTDAFDSTSSDSDDESEELFTLWQDVHQTICKTIDELGGRVAPKLNWSAPKDATWINPTNSMECRSANDVYMMLKSSDFVTHDLEHAFDDCVSGQDSSQGDEKLVYNLVLRKWVSAWNPSVEFRCFVRRRKLLGICQRDLNHYEFLFELRPTILTLVQEFFDQQLRDSFTEENFAFDIYVPQPYTKVWLVDINPWALRTDPILFSWKELLEMDEPQDALQEIESTDSEESPSDSFVRLSIGSPQSAEVEESRLRPAALPTPSPSASSSSSLESAEESWTTGTLKLRLIRKSDPEAYSFNTPQYSAHKLPKDVVDASSGAYDAEQLKDFSNKWQELVQQGQAQS